MKAPALLVLAIFTCGGCASAARRPEPVPPTANGPVNLSDAFSNAQAYDKYVVQRATELRNAGKSNADAEKIAEKEATKRYGARRSAQTETPSVTVGGQWGQTRQEPRELRPSEIDQALAKAKR